MTCVILSERGKEGCIFITFCSEGKFVGSRLVMLKGKGGEGEQVVQVWQIKGKGE